MAAKLHLVIVNKHLIHKQPLLECAAEVRFSIHEHLSS